jgi:large subunit ribosomal protein L24
MLKKFKKGDKVLVISGNSKGKVGNIQKVDYKEGRVFIENVNLGSFHIKPTSSSQGSISQKERSIHVSNISHIDSEGNRVKVSFYLEDGDGKSFKRKYRLSKKKKEKI